MQFSEILHIVNRISNSIRALGMLWHFHLVPQPSMPSAFLTSLYLAPVLFFLIWYMRRHRRLERQSIATIVAATEAGMLEPPTLHPDIDPIKCIGCGACVAACPEQDAHPVLGMIGKKARLVGPTDCIGHGACKVACPVNAITLVFGTATRGVDIPVVQPNFETNVPGIFIAGELGGMGLIRNAIEQGRQAMTSVQALLDEGHSCELDVVIVGAGPAGFTAALAAKEANLRSKTVEQEALGGTVAHFPRQKLVMTRPATLPLVGSVKFHEVQKEELLGFWQDVEAKTGIEISYNERVESIEPTPESGGFRVKTTRNVYNTRSVLLAIGRRGTPRTLGVPGEQLAKVAYRLIDPEQYQDQHVLVVGGGDSALEAAVSIADVPGTTVSLSYRSAAFTRAKPKNREMVEQMSASGNLRVIYSSTVSEIGTTTVSIEHDRGVESIPNDAVIVAAGGILPTGFLKSIGIDVETKWGSA